MAETIHMTKPKSRTRKRGVKAIKLATNAVSRISENAIKHVFVLMMENRSFDHFLGAMPGVDGVDVSSPRSNLERPKSAKKYIQAVGAVRKMKPDPHHETINVLRQIDGAGLGSMGGFVYDFVLEEPNAQKAWPQVMSYFADGELPALHELAKAFCICDTWFSSVPGPTWTNRFFVHSGTSQGWVNMPSLPQHPNLHKYDQTTVFDRLNERGIKWRIYAGDIPQSLVLYNQRKKVNRRNYSRMSNFFKDLQHPGGGMPEYVFIEPAYLSPGQNDQHPPHDVLKGDDLIASVYNAIRANEAIWADSLLIVTWDEHGGFYDHVSPPVAVPPDHKTQEFEFDRYGVRVPALLISRWVEGGSVFRPEQGTLDHTSILRFLTDKHDLGPLGERTAAAASFAAAIRSSPNDSTPSRVGTKPHPRKMSIVSEGPPSGLNKNQAALIDFTRQLEIEMDAPPAEVGIRAMKAATGVQGEVEAAKERVRLFLGQGQPTQ